MPVPVVKFYEFAVSGVSPSGSRHQTSHASFTKELNTAASGALDFGDVNIDAETESDTKVVVFRVSDLNGNTRVQNMRFWIPSIPGRISTCEFNTEIQNEWRQDNVLGEASGNVSTTLPTTQNLFRGTAATYAENWPHLSGVDDANASQYIYLNVTCPTTAGTGKFGAGGEGEITMRVTLDYL